MLLRLSTTLFPLALGLPLLIDAGARGEVPNLDHVSLLTLDGEQVELGDYVGEKPLVVAYTGVGCPISMKYAPRLERLSAAYGERGIEFVGVNANPQDSREEIGVECEELGISFPVLKDFRQQLTKTLGAATTTEVFVLDANGALRFRGPVDDQYSLGASKPAPTANYLTDALEALLAGKEPALKELAAPGCKLAVLPEAELPEAVTWSRDIAPITQRRCEACHRPGQVGPFALQSYDDARGWAEMIAEVVEEGRMPPWNASHDYNGVFANERRLSKSEKDKILRWVEGGMPRGNPEEDPPAKEWSDDWRIGEPDEVIRFEKYMYSGDPVGPKGFEVPREGVVDYQYFTVQTNFEEDRWIQALEVRPGAADVVHHVLIMIDEGGGNVDFTSYLAVAVPGDTPSVYPDGYAKKLPAGTNLVFQLHYTPNGKQRYDLSEMALIFADEEPIFEVVTQAVVNNGFKIPPGADNYEVRGSSAIEEDTGLIALFPHMHTRGKDFKYVAHYPDGTSEELLHSDYDFNWQESYLYRDPKPLFANTRIECVGHFDNSEANLNNPDPESWVYWGEQTFEEMFIGYYDIVRELP
jgi:peroxiredoxin